MMQFGRPFAYALQRRIAVVLALLLLSWIGIGRAEASCNSQSGACTTIQEAWTRANSDKTYYQTNDQNNGLPNYNYRITGSGTQASPFRVQHCTISQYVDCGNEANWSTDTAYYGITGCTAPTPDFDKTTGTCVNKAAQCLARNDDVPTTNTAIYTGQQCIDGCTYGARASKTGQASDGTTAIIYGEMGYTGEVCTTNTTNPLNPNEDRPQSCTPAGGGMTMCIKDDGRHCYSASGPGAINTSRQICWSPGETGTKTDGPVLQTRGPGTATPPAPTPPAGETLQPGTGPKTSTTTTPGGTTITTTTINNTTNYGTNGGSTNDGEPSDGTGSEEDEGEGSASGGEGCEAPPTCAGDVIGCATLVQVWRNRCTEGQNKITGGAECDSNGNPLFTCAGDQVLCKQALLQAEALCRSKKDDANGDGQPDWTDGDGPAVVPGDDGEDGETSVRNLGVSESLLDTENIFGEASCPVLSVTVYSQEVSTASIPEWCTIVSIMKAVVLMMGAFAAIRILLGN